MLEQVRTDATRERDELRAAMEARTQAIEDARNDLRARAERAEAEAEADMLRRELAELPGTAETSDDDARGGRGRRERGA